MSDARTGEQPWFWFGRAPTRRPPPRPRVAVDLRRCLPAWALRIGCAVVATGCTLLVASNGGHWTIAGALIAAMAVRPSGAAPSLFVVGVGLLVLAAEEDPFHPRVFLLALGLHLTVQLATVVGDLHWLAPVELGVLAGFAAPFLVIQALVQSAALMGAWMTTRQVSVTWLPVVAGIALAVMTWAIIIRLRADGDRP